MNATNSHAAENLAQFSIKTFQNGSNNRIGEPGRHRNYLKKCCRGAESIPHRLPQTVRFLAVEAAAYQLMGLYRSEDAPVVRARQLPVFAFGSSSWDTCVWSEKRRVGGK